MPKIPKAIKEPKENIEIIKEELNEETRDDSDSSIELPKKEKKPYVLTEARKAQFDKARLVRQQNIIIANEAKLKQKEEVDLLKKQLKNKKVEKVTKLKEKIVEQIQEEENSSSSEEEEIIIRKSKPKKKKVVYIQEDNSSEEEEYEEPKPKAKKAVKQVRDLRPIIQYM